MEVTPADLLEDDSRGLLAQISEYQPERAHHKIKLLKVFNTTQWIIKDFESFKSSIARPQIKQQPNQNCLWVSGIIGCGKTFLANTIIQVLLDHHDKQSSRDFVAHVYFDSEKRDSLKATDLFRSYVKQFLRHLYTRRQKPPRAVILALRRMFGSRVTNPSCSEILRELLLPLISEVEGTVLVVDGLDLCARDEYLDALVCFASILEKTSAKVVICGRDELDIKSRLPGSIRLEVTAARNQDDIAVYVKHHVKKRSIFDGPISNNSNTVTQIIETLINKANGMFLWARLQIDVLWDTCRTDAEIVVALKELPKDLDETYEKCLERLRRKQEPYALRVLRYVYEAKNPLTVDALGEALATDPISGELQSKQIPPFRFIIECGANLVIFDEVERFVVPAHHSVRRFLNISRAGVLEKLEFHVWDDAELKLGAMCITHLCWHMDLALSEENRTHHELELTTLQMPSFSQMSRWARPSKALAYVQRPSLIWRKPASNPKTNDQPVLIQRLVERPNNSKPVAPFEQYARFNWLTLSRSESGGYMLWRKFWKLAFMCSDDSQICPWNQGRIGGNADIVWWAIDNSHVPLYDIAMERSTMLDGTSRPDFTLPLAYHEGLLPLYLAAKRGSLDMFTRVATHCDLDAKDHSTGRTALHYAAEQGHSEIVKFILQAYSSSVPLCDYYDIHSALIFALKAQSLETVKEIEAICGRQVWQEPTMGRVLDTLLMGERNLELANHVLLKVISVRGHSKLLTCIVKHELVSLVPDIVKAGVPLDTPISSNGISSRELYSDEPEVICEAVFFALEASTPDLATALVMNGAGRSAHLIHNNQTWRPFHLALSRGWASLASSLLDSGDFTRTLTPRYVKTFRFRISVTNPCVRWLSVVCPIYGSIDGFTIASSSQDALVGQCYPNVLHVVKVRGADNDIHALEVELSLDRSFGFYLMIGTPETDFTAWRKRPTPSDRSLTDLHHSGTLVWISYDGTVKDFGYSPKPYNMQHIQLVDGWL
ncbi:ankyrin [Aureobasidium pullulans]|uniref:Ankyrin n=1 Tax=Aureobasidium pullulans TaxID=5580 RepID=A0A4V4IUV9_AURPU|nr:ankyrin [Aureobasidium pullulans]